LEGDVSMIQDNPTLDLIIKAKVKTDLVHLGILDKVSGDAYKQLVWGHTCIRGLGEG